MDIETITKLLDAGYTKQEIDAMQSNDDAGGQTDKNAGAENQTAGDGQSNAGAGNAGAGNESAGNESSQNINTDAAIKALTDTVNALTNTVKAMQEKNANSASGGKAETKSVDDVMKSFIDTL